MSKQFFDSTGGLVWNHAKKREVERKGFDFVLWFILL